VMLPGSGTWGSRSIGIRKWDAFAWCRASLLTTFNAIAAYRSLHVMYNRNHDVGYTSLNTFNATLCFPSLAPPALPGELLIHRLPFRLTLQQRLRLLFHRKSPLLIHHGVSHGTLLVLHRLRLFIVILHRLLVEIRHILQRLRPNKRPFQFHRHLLDTRRPVPSLVLRSRVVLGADSEGFALRDSLQLDV
jgi:hypothetical protein